MDTQCITNGKGEKTAVIIPLGEYEDLLHQHHLSLELTDEYRSTIDKMLDEEKSGEVEYVSYKDIKDRFRRK